MVVAKAPPAVFARTSAPRVVCCTPRVVVAFWKVLAPDHVLVPFRSGIVAPEVPVATYAALANVPPVPMASVLLSVAVRVSVFETVKTLPFAIVSVADEAGAVIVTLLIEVAVATPSKGVVSVGVSCTTKVVPVPV